MDASFANDLIVKYGYVTLFILIAVENIEFFGSIPTSLIAAVIGVTSSRGLFNPYWAIALLTISSVVGDVIGYWIGRIFGRRVLERFGGIMIRNGRLEKTEKFFQRWGGWGVFITRYIFASFQALINIIAGVAKMPFGVFFGAAFIGELIWSIGYFALGYFFWQNIASIFDVFRRVGIIGGILVVLALATIGFFIYRRYRRKGKATPPTIQ